MSKKQIIIVVVFLVSLLVGVISLALYSSKNMNSSTTNNEKTKTEEVSTKEEAQEEENSQEEANDQETKIELDYGFSAVFTDEVSSTESWRKYDTNLDIYYEDENIYTSNIELAETSETRTYQGDIISADYGYDLYFLIDNFFDFKVIKISVNKEGEVLEKYESETMYEIRDDFLFVVGMQNNNLYLKTASTVNGISYGVEFYVLDSELNLISPVNDIGMSEYGYSVPEGRYTSGIGVELEDGYMKIEYDYYDSEEDLYASHNQDSTDDVEPKHEEVDMDLI